MRLIDRISLQRGISMLLDFILAVLKIFAPKNTDDGSVSVDEDKKWRPRWRRKKK